MKALALALSAAVLLVGCGATPSAPRMGAANTGALAARSVGAEALMSRYEAVPGYSEADVTERARLIEALGRTGSPEAARFLMGVDASLVDVPAAAAARLDGVLTSAMEGLLASAGQVSAYDRFNVWKELEKSLGRKKKRKGGSGGGGGTPPADVPA